MPTAVGTDRERPGERCERDSVDSKSAGLGFESLCPCQSNSRLSRTSQPPLVPTWAQPQGWMVGGRDGSGRSCRPHPGRSDTRLGVPMCSEPRGGVVGHAGAEGGLLLLAVGCVVRPVFAGGLGLETVDDLIVLLGAAIESPAPQTMTNLSACIDAKSWAFNSGDNANLGLIYS